jgi:flagellar biogenesis protein FliO
MKLLSKASFLWLLSAPAIFAQSTNSLPLTSLAPTPGVGAALFRVMGALLLVLAIFLGGVWLFRNWQRLSVQRGAAPKLNVLEVRSLGGRHAIYVVGYERERLLLASGPTGVSFLSQLPPADNDATPADAPKAAGTFPQMLAEMMKGNLSKGGKP